MSFLKAIVLTLFCLQAGIRVAMPQGDLGATSELQQYFDENTTNEKNRYVLVKPAQGDNWLELREFNEQIQKGELEGKGAVVKGLQFREVYVTLNDIESLSKMHELATLEFIECEFGGETTTLVPLGKQCKSLEMLSFSRCRISRAVLRDLPVFRKVRELEFEETYIGNGIIDFSTIFPQLEAVSFISSGNGNKDAKSLAKLMKLSRIEFQECDLSIEGLKLLSASSSVTYIMGANIDITKADAEQLSNSYPHITFEVSREPALK